MGCRLGRCDGSGWIEIAARTVTECECRGGLPRCPVPGCTELCPDGGLLCRKHARAIPERLRVAAGRAMRAYEGGRMTFDEFDQIRQTAIDAARQEVLLG